MALSYSGSAVEHREILLKNKPASMLGYSPKGTVPVLVLDDKIIDESLDVMLWACSIRDNDDWLLSQLPKKKAEMMALIERCDQQFKPQLDQYKYADRHPLTEQEYKEQALWFLTELDQRLTEHQYLINDKMSMADVAIFPFIRQFAFVDKKWFDKSEYQSLYRWLEQLLQWPLFVSIMHKYTLWSDN